jgi:hypothetical protein
MNYILYLSCIGFITFFAVIGVISIYFVLKGYKFRKEVKNVK